MKSQNMTTATVAIAVSLVLLAGCSESTNNIPQKNGQTDEINQRLKVLGDSEAFYSALRESLINQSSGYYGGEVYGTNGSFESVDANTDASASAPTAGSTEESSISDSADVSSTTVQEVGVDEQDLMKSDGQMLYVLDNVYSGYYGGDVIEVELVDDGVVGDTLPTDLPYNNSVTTQLRILSLQADVPDTTPIKDLELDLGNDSGADGMYLYKKDNQTKLFLTSSSFANYWASWGTSSAFVGQQSKITEVDVSNPETAAVSNALSLDGQIISSRRIGNYLLLASRYYPSIEGADPYQMTPEEYRQAVSNADMSNAMPKLTRLSDGQTQNLVNSDSCFVAAQAEGQTYYSADIISLAIIDLDTMSLTDSECYLGASETLYASTDAVYLATTRWSYSDIESIAADTDTPVTEPSREVDPDDESSTSTVIDESYVYQDPRVDTAIHRFALNDGQLSYSGSGTVTGHLGWNPNRKPFRLSDKDGYLRVATYSDQQNDSVSPINLTVLQADGNGGLSTVAQLPNENRPAHIGKPGETLYASRFLGDKAYLVTFRQTDPLYVIDLSTPNDPYLAGELEIDGYSDYLQPIGENYLLGIGKDAEPAPDNIGDGFGALAQGIKLSLFNVADPSNPYEVQSVVVGERGTESEALHNHRAITIQAANDLHPTRVAFGIDVAGSATPTGSQSVEWWNEWNYSGLHGFEVSTGDAASIQQMGVMKVAQRNQNGSYDGYGGTSRAVLVDDAVFYVHGHQVYSAHWSNLEQFTGPK